MTTDAEREAPDEIFEIDQEGSLLCGHEPVADDLVERLTATGNGGFPGTVIELIEERWNLPAEAAARITSDAAVIAAKDAEIERLRNYCGAAARDYAGTLAALEEAAGGGILESFPRTAKDLHETSEFMALAAEGKEDPTRWGAELNDAKARIAELQAQATRAIRKCRNAVEFFDKVKVATEGEKSAVGRDHWDRLESAVRYVAALNTGESDAG